MQSNIRIIFLFVLLGFIATQISGIKSFYAHAFPPPDNRPALSILFLGNSRTFYNNMPHMIREMADSAQSPQKYEITMYARPGVTFENLWNDPAAQKLLRQKWDYVVLQGSSADQVNDTMNSRFLTYGAKLAAAAKQAGSPPVLLVAWRCTEEYYHYYPELKAMGPQRHFGLIQQGYYELAQATGASSVNVGRVWEKLLASSRLPLTVDGNHPTVRGSYLVALMMYRFFSNDDLANVTYLPAGVAPDDADMLKTAAQRW